MAKYFYRFAPSLPRPSNAATKIIVGFLDFFLGTIETFLFHDEPRFVMVHGTNGLSKGFIILESRNQLSCNNDRHGITPYGNHCVWDRLLCGIATVGLRQTVT
jgi:hypothetical protein